MYNEINQQMEEAQQGIFRLNKINSMLKELTIQLKYVESKVEEFKTTLDAENDDVDRLANKSLAHLFHTVLGDISEKLEKEQSEVLAARLKYEQAVSELEQLNYQISQLNTEAAHYKNCQSVYQYLFKQKREMLVTGNFAVAQRILELTEQLNISNNNRREIEEAIAAGNEVTSHIDSALKSLDSAEGWGTWDLLGGGLISDMMKHSHIDEAKSEAEQIQMKLMQFRTELADVRINYNIHFETNGFGKFADFFFDGLIADWCMQSRIEETMNSVRNVKQQVQEALYKLNEMKSAEAAHIEQLDRDMSELITKA